MTESGGAGTTEIALVGFVTGFIVVHAGRISFILAVEFLVGFA